MTIKEKSDLWRKMNVRKVAMDLLFRNDVYMKYINLQKDQMLHGEDNEGGEIGSYKNSAYAAMKERMNSLAGGGVDLRLTGNFYNAIALTASSNNKYRVFSRDEKNGKLVKKYGEKIFYLNPIHLLEFRKFYMPYLAREIERATSK